MWSACSSGLRSGGWCWSRAARSGRWRGGWGWRATPWRGRWAARRRPRIRRVPAGSKLDPFRDWIGEQLRAEPTMPAQRLREIAVELGYAGGKTIFDDYVRELRPRFARRTFQRTVYRPGELVQCDLWEPRELISGRAWADAAWVGGDRGGVLVAGDRRRADLQQGGARHPVGPEPQPAAARRAAAEAGVGPRVSDRGRRASHRGVRCVLRPARRRAGSSWMPGTRRPRARWSARTGSCAPTSSRAGRSPTRRTFSCSWTAGVIASTGGCIAPSATSRSSAWPRSTRACGRCRRGCPTSTAGS